MKRKILVISLIVLCIATAVSGTYAYISSDGNATNVITSGEKVCLSIKIGDEIISGVNLGTAMPGGTVQSQVSFRSDTSTSCYVRAKVNVMVTLKDGSEGDPSVVTLGINTEDWILKDSWYYYKLPLNKNDYTPQLISTASFDKSMGNAYKQCKVSLEIKVQGVQSANNPIPADGTAADVKGWPL